MIDVAIDFATLLRQVPPVLLACLKNDNEYSQLRALRLVNKECSKVAVMELKDFLFTAVGPSMFTNDTNIGCTKVLRHACLLNLKVKLSISGNGKSR